MKLNNNIKLYALIAIMAALLTGMYIIINFFTNYAYLTLDIKPSGAKVTIKDKVYVPGETAKLRPGTYKIAISESGYEEAVILDYKLARNDKKTIKRILLSKKVSALNKTLPYDDGEFTISSSDCENGCVFSVGLVVINNYDWQEIYYLDNLKAQKDKLREYLGTFKIKISEININWLQSEAKDL